MFETTTQQLPISNETEVLRLIETTVMGNMASMEHANGFSQGRPKTRKMCTAFGSLTSDLGR